MNSDERTAGHGPDNMGDDEQEFELAEYKQYIEDPPEGPRHREDNDDDGEAAQDWSDTHPRRLSGMTTTIPMTTGRPSSRHPRNSRSVT